MYLLRIALRNLFKNRRRSLITMLTVAVGFASINVFGGWAFNIFQGLENQSIRGEALGHLTLAKPGFFSRGGMDPAGYVFRPEELDRVIALLAVEPEVRLVTRRLRLTGMVSNGVVSTIFIGEGMVPEDILALRGDGAPISTGPIDPRNSVGPGGTLDAANPIGVSVASDLAGFLDLEIGGQAVLLTTTLEGQANALDAEVVQVYNTGSAALNDKFMIVPYDLARRLLDAPGPDRLVVLLSDVGLSDAMRTRLVGKLAAAGLEVEIRTWQELSEFYRRVRDFLGTIFLFIFVINVIIVITAVINTMSMAILERTREIGTLRTLGMKRPQIARLFSTEGMLLALIGCALGTPLSLLMAMGANALELSYVPPNFSTLVVLRVDVQLWTVGAAWLTLVPFGGAAALAPAWGAARKPIVDALGHV